MILASFAEAVSIGAVLPFLGVLTSPDKIFANPLVLPFIEFFNIQSAQELLLPVTLIFVLAAVLAGLARIALIWFQTRLSMDIGADLSSQVYLRTLYQPYSLHISRNSSEILAGARKAEELVYYIVQPVLILISSVAILVSVLVMLLAIQPLIAISALFGFALIYAIVVAVTRRRIEKNSLTIAEQQGKVTRAIRRDWAALEMY